MLNMSALTGYVRKKTLDDALEADETSESTGICSAVSLWLKDVGLRFRVSCEAVMDWVVLR